MIGMELERNGSEFLMENSDVNKTFKKNTITNIIEFIPSVLWKRFYR